MSERPLVGNLGAHFGGVYGSKALDLLLLSVVTRKLSMDLVGTYFLADAAAGTVLRFVDLGLYPVLQRRAARGEAGRRLLFHGTAIRLASVALSSAVFATVAALKYPDHWALTAAFFFSSGLYVVHEVPRAILAGREAFVTTARIGVSLRAVEVFVAAPAVWFGFGVWPWLLGRLLGQVALLATLYRAAWKLLPAGGAFTGRGIVREGMPFWFVTLFQSAIFRIDTLVVGAYLGLTQTAHLGLASRIIGGGLSMVSSLILVTYPSLAREKRRFITPREASVVLGLSFVLGAGMLAGAPLAVRIITGHFAEGPIAVVRTLAPVIVLTGVARSLEAWLQAKNKERGLAVLTVVTGVVSAVALVVLVKGAGTLGAAAARDFRAGTELLLMGLYTLAVLDGVHSPFAWLLGKLGPLAPFAKRLVPKEAERVASAIERVPGVVSVELTGSARSEALPAFRLGSSDFDFTIATSVPPAELPATVLRVERTAQRRRLVAQGTALVLDEAVLREARALGHPVLTARSDRLRGTAITPSPDAIHAREWGTSHAIERFFVLQRAALEESRHDGGARAAPLRKHLHHVLHHLGGADAHLPRLREQGFTLPEDAMPGRVLRRSWFTAPEVAALLACASAAVEHAGNAATAEWAEEPVSAASPPPWLLASRGAADRAGRLARGLPLLSIELVPTGPVTGEALTLVATPGWSAAEWLTWVLRAASAGPLEGPFRAHPWPLALPLGAVRALAFVEHAPLVWRARRGRAVAASGASPPSRRPPPDYDARAGRRGLVQALIRLPMDLARGDGRAPERAALPGSPRGHSEARLRVYAEGRLAALRLLSDGEDAPDDPAALRAAYRDRYDDALARAYRARGPETPPDGPEIRDILASFLADGLAALKGPRKGPCEEPPD